MRAKFLVVVVVCACTCAPPDDAGRPPVVSDSAGAAGHQQGQAVDPPVAEHAVMRRHRGNAEARPLGEVRAIGEFAHQGLRQRDVFGGGAKVIRVPETGS